MKPVVTLKTLPHGASLVRFSELNDLFYYDVGENNPNGFGVRNNYSSRYGLNSRIQDYVNKRMILDKEKIEIIQAAEKGLSIDKDFLELIYKSQSEKRKSEKNKFCGNFLPVAYSRGEDKMFTKGIPGAKKVTIDMAFQVGTFMGGDYKASFAKILKTVMMARAMGINMNIDVFDSDTEAINGEDSYVICNVAKSYEKLDLKKILTFSHELFFHYSLFNGYSAWDKLDQNVDIGTFISESKIKRDLGGMYDVIGGNMLQGKENSQMVSKIMKIAWKK